MKRLRIRFLVKGAILGMLFVPYVTAQDQTGSHRIPAVSILEQTLKESGLDAVRIKFKELLAVGDSEVDFVEGRFLEWGYRLLGEGRIPEAVAILELTAAAFPRSYDVHMSLGRAYRLAGEETRGRESVGRAFELANQALLKKFLEGNRESVAASAEEVIDRHLEAIGGRENLEKIRTMVISYTGFDSLDGATFITRYYKFPHLVRQDNAAAGSATSTDGENVWRETSTGWESVSGSNWVYVPDIYYDFIGYEERGITYVLLGLEAIDRQIYYHLLKRYADGESRDYYFSAEDGLFRMERRDFGVGKDIKSHWDYRRHAGILFPHLFIVTLDAGFGQVHGGIVKDIKINLPLEDSLFGKR